LNVLFWTVALSGACESDEQTTGGFASDLPAAGFFHGSKDAGADAAPDASDGNPETPANADDPRRAIEEADVIELAGNRLFALSRISGLAVVDISNPKARHIVGRYRDVSGTPFEMYLRGTVAILMFYGWGQFGESADGGYAYVTTSKVVAVDISNPAKIVSLRSFDVPGTISDSRIVGERSSTNG
jgi:hypothetical protein